MEKEDYQNTKIGKMNTVPTEPNQDNKRPALIFQNLIFNLLDFLCTFKVISFTS